MYISCGDGWKSLYQPVIDKVEEINKESDEKFEITEIKEKFGLLDISLNKYREDLLSMLKEAMEMSQHVCEDCGKPAERFQADGWYYTLCKECYDKIKNKWE